MDNRMYNVPADMTTRNSVVIDGIVPHTSMNSLVQSSYSFDLNHQNHMMALVPVLSTFQGEPVIDSHSDLHVTNNSGVVETNQFVTSERRNNVRESTFCSSSFTDDTVYQAIPHSAASLATLLAARGNLQENLNNLAISATPNISSEAYVSNHCSNNSNSLFGTSVNCGYDELLGSMNSQWEINKYAAPSELGEKTAVRTGFQPYSSTGNLDPNGWLSSSNGASVMTYNSYSSSNLSNGLALTLATSRPSIVGGMDIRNQRSDIGCSGTAQRFDSSDQNSCNSEELSPSYGSCKPPQLSQIICGSRYLHVVQEILSDIASYSLEILDPSSFSSARLVSENGASVMDPDFDSRFEVDKESALRKQEMKTKKAKLLALLQMLDECYNQCMDEIHTVVSAFHAATETDPHIHARFALQTISVLYKNLRERISTHFLSMNANSNPASPSESGRSFDIQKQLALQHLKKKDHQIWRPQRGLPERSVSVLRAWMFQNFLHPYPKDAEKHLLAVKSGLTRNQVSNWFINARVRLWKPMIEEMYLEMNRRKNRQSDQNTERNHRSHHHHISINNHKFGVN